MHVRLFARMSAANIGHNFLKFCIGDFLRKSVERVQIWSKSAKYVAQLTWKIKFVYIVFNRKGRAARSKAWDCGRLLAGILCSIPAGSKEICLLWVLFVVRYRSLCRAGHLSRGVLPSVVCLSVIVTPR